MFEQKMYPPTAAAGLLGTDLVNLGVGTIHPNLDLSNNGFIAFPIISSGNFEFGMKVTKPGCVY